MIGYRVIGVNVSLSSLMGKGATGQPFKMRYIYIQSYSYNWHISNHMPIDPFPDP
jgi:hypothetical protein